MAQDDAKSIFLKIIDLPSEQRLKEQAAMCGDDAALREAVQALIEAHERAQAFLATPAPTSDSQRPTAEITEAPGMTVGRYKLLQQIGEGGFGVVYMAEQREPVKRTVALKVIKLGMDTRQVIARFEAERQALAMMDHPNIARVLDAGATETGRPYFVMELVKGIPITHYCEQQNVDMETRLKLFCDVCRAVQHAHQKGIIHRDLKPSNVMVTLHDGVPVVKVIDFGIAKATNARLTERTLFTGFGQFIGTPEYMSPEQAELSGLDVDTRSDVYSLGVLLYELLTSMLPFDSKSLRAAGYDEIRRIIREDEPPTPSSRLSGLATQQRKISLDKADSANAGTRQTGPKRPDFDALVRRVRGDLDWIVMKCLAKDRTRRYETARDLSQDIERHLIGDPVEAAPPSRMYRLRKLARRHRGRVATASVIVLLLLAGIAGTSAFAVRAEHRRVEAVSAQEAEAEARREAQEAQAEAQQRAEELDQVAEFQARQLAGIRVSEMGAAIRSNIVSKRRSHLETTYADSIEDSVQALAQELEGVNFTNVALEVLDSHIFDRALQTVASDFENQPLVKARLLQTLASTLRRLGLHVRAMASQEEALEIRRNLLGDEHPDTLDSINNSAILMRVLGRMSDAEEYFRKALVGHRTCFGDDHRKTMISLSNMAAILAEQGKYDEAEPFYIESLESRRRILGPTHPDTLNSIDNRGIHLYRLGRLPEAEQLIREALAGRRQVLGEDDPHTLTSLNHLGAVLRAMGRLEETEVCYQMALEGRRRALGDDHPQTLQSLNNLGVLYLTMGRLSDAEPLFLQSYQRREALHGPDHPDTLLSLGNVAVVLRGQSRLEDAEVYAHEHLERCRRALPPDHLTTLSAIETMARLLREQRKVAEAEPFARDALDGFGRIAGVNHPRTVSSKVHLADVLHDLDRFEEAHGHYIEGMIAARQALPADHWELGTYLSHHAKNLTVMQRYAEAESALLEAEEILSAARSADDSLRTDVFQQLVEFYTEWHSVESDAGHDESAAQWRARLPAVHEIEDDAAAAQP